MPESNEFLVDFDKQETIDTIYLFNQSGGFNELLKAVGISNQFLKEKPPAEISEGAVTIGWEHYKTNYIDTPKSSVQMIDDIDDDDDDEDGDIDIEEIFNNRMQFHSLQKPMHHTPWGKFEADSPLSPVNLYDLYLGHFKGFNTNSIPNFKELMSSIEGVALWGQIDPYCVVIAPARSYSTTEVKYNIDRAIYSALGISLKNSNLDLEDYLIDLCEKSEELFNNGVENFTIVFPEPNFNVVLEENPDEEKENEVEELISRIQGLIVIKNGKFYEKVKE